MLHRCFWSTVMDLGLHWCPRSSGAPGIFQGLQNFALGLPDIYVYKHCDATVGNIKKGASNTLLHMKQQRHKNSLCCLLKLPKILLWDTSVTICSICGCCTSTDILHISCEVGKTILLPKKKWWKKSTRLSNFFSFRNSRVLYCISASIIEKSVTLFSSLFYSRSYFNLSVILFFCVCVFHLARRALEHISLDMFDILNRNLNKPFSWFVSLKQNMYISNSENLFN